MKIKWTLSVVASILLLSSAVFINAGNTNAPNSTRVAAQQTEFDLVVVGGEPEGVIAAVAAARHGVRTLLVEERDGLGGLMTYGMLNYLDLAAHDNKSVNTGLFKEWHDRVGGKPVFDVEAAKSAFLNMVHKEKNITLLTNTRVSRVLLSSDGKTLAGVETVGRGGTTHQFQGERFIDCTQDADLAALAGVPYFVGQADIGRQTEMAATLMIHLKGVNWDGIHQAFRMKTLGGGFINDNAAWGFWKIKSDYHPQDPNTRVRGLNIARNSDGTIYINALQILGVNGLDAKQKQDAYQRGKAETPHVVEYLRKEVPGFEHAEVASYPPELYIRETRHILAEYQLSITDVWENRDQVDGIGLGAYPVDIQATSADKGDMVVIDPAQYAIPFRSLVPQKIDGLLVASRSAGYSSLAAGSARTIPTGMTVGEAAGVAAALSLQHGVNFRDMTKDRVMIDRLRFQLKQDGGRVEHYQMGYPYRGAWFYPAVKRLVGDGLLFAGYENTLHEQDGITEEEFTALLEMALYREKKGSSAAVKERLAPLQPAGKALTAERAAEIALAAAGQEAQDGSRWQQALTNDQIDKEIKNRVQQPTHALQRAEGWQLLAGLLDKLK